MQGVGTACKVWCLHARCRDCIQSVGEYVQAVGDDMQGVEDCIQQAEDYMHNVVECIKGRSSEWAEALMMQPLALVAMSVTQKKRKDYTFRH